ncbi:MAG: rhtC, partial [Thermoleophilia bacterium]|nr:rhtC [Thermoleophilia bacterium]
RAGVGRAAAGAAGEQTGPALEPSPRARTLYVRGFFTNLLNVKIALFYIAFLPQFAPAGDDFVLASLGLALVQALVGFLWLISYAALVARAGHALGTSPRAKAWLEGTTGAALVGFGVRLASASR